jgi:NitT/TauT family transport system ATP-binding protein
MKAQIQVDNVSKIFQTEDGEIRALDGVSLEIEAGEFVCLLGPSGCGKSTLLDAIGGFAIPTSGSVVVDGKLVVSAGPDRGMVFQEYALFPWMTVEQNIRFGMELNKIPEAQIANKSAELLALFKLTDFRRRFPKDLSGGMRQRVAIARVLALDPPVLLMDEPFGALDALTRLTLQDELLKVWREFKKTIVFVTHGIDEALYLADRIVVLTYRPGRLKKIIKIDLPRPRDPISPEFNKLKSEITELVMEEKKRETTAEFKNLASSK